MGRIEPNGLNKIAKIDYSYLCLRGENLSCEQLDDKLWKRKTKDCNTTNETYSWSSVIQTFCKRWLKLMTSFLPPGTVRFVVSMFNTKTLYRTSWEKTVLWVQVWWRYLDVLYWFPVKDDGRNQTSSDTKSTNIVRSYYRINDRITFWI